MAGREHDELVGLVIDGYELLKPLGAGGMGVVYEARHRVLGRRAAVKLLRTAAARDVEASKRFRVEAQAVNAIRHPGLVDVFGFGALPNGDLYLVMEHLEGRTFEALVAERAPLPLGEALALTAEVLDAVGAAHARGVVHRDLKPSNIFLVEPPGARPYVKVLDFGIAKVLDPTGFVSVHTHAASVMGTPLYMSPEQARTEAASPASDLYSVGLVLFELLTGRLAFEAPNPARVMWMHVHEPAPFAADTNVRVPTEVDDLIQWLLAKRPSSRPPSAAFVAERLRALAPAPGGAQAQVRVTAAVPSAERSRPTATPVGGRAPLVLPEPSVEEALAPTVPSAERSRPPAAPDGAGAPFGPAALEAARQRSREARRRARVAVGGSSAELDERVAERGGERRGPTRDGSKGHRRRLAVAIAAGVLLGAVVAGAISIAVVPGRFREPTNERPRGDAKALPRRLSEGEVRRRLLDAAAEVLAPSAPNGGECSTARPEFCFDARWNDDSRGGVVPLTGVVTGACDVSAVRLSVISEDKPVSVSCGTIPFAAGAAPARRGPCEGQRGVRFATALDLSGVAWRFGVNIALQSAGGAVVAQKRLERPIAAWSSLGPDAARAPPALEDSLLVVPDRQLFEIAGARVGGRRVTLRQAWDPRWRDFGSTGEATERPSAEQLDPPEVGAPDRALAALCGRLLGTPGTTVAQSASGARPSTEPVAITLWGEAAEASPMVVTGTTLLRGEVVASSPDLALVLALGRWGSDAGVDAEPLVTQVPVRRREADGGAPFTFDFAAPLDFEDVPPAGGEVWLLAQDARGALAEARVPVRPVGWPELSPSDEETDLSQVSMRLDAGPGAFWLRDVRVRRKSYEVRFDWSPARRRHVMTDVVAMLEVARRAGGANAVDEAPGAGASCSERRAQTFEGTFAVYGDGQDGGLARTLVWSRGREAGALPAPMRSVALANLDGDGRVDLAGVAIDGGVVISVDRRSWRPVESPDSRGARQLVAGDFDCDGFDELACVTEGGQVRVTKDRAHWVTVSDGPATSVLAADFDPDGRDELVELHEHRVARVLLDVPLVPTPGRHPLWWPVCAQVREVAIGDFDAAVPGPELVVRDLTKGLLASVDRVANLRPQLGGTIVRFQPLKVAQTAGLPVARQTLVAHPDGPGRTVVVALGFNRDVYVSNEGRRTLRLLDGASTGGFTHLAAADLDGDGRSALLGFGEQGGVWVSRGLGAFRFDRALSAALCPKGRGPCLGVRVAVR